MLYDHIYQGWYLTNEAISRPGFLSEDTTDFSILTDQIGPSVFDYKSFEDKMEGVLHILDPKLEWSPTSKNLEKIRNISWSESKLRVPVDYEAVDDRNGDNLIKDKTKWIDLKINRFKFDGHGASANSDTVNPEKHLIVLMGGPGKPSESGITLARQLIGNDFPNLVVYIMDHRGIGDTSFTDDNSDNLWTDGIKDLNSRAPFALRHLTMHNAAMDVGMLAHAIYRESFHCNGINFHKDDKSDLFEIQKHYFGGTGDVKSSLQRALDDEDLIQDSSIVSENISSTGFKFDDFGGGEGSGITRWFRGKVSLFGVSYGAQLGYYTVGILPHTFDHAVMIGLPGWSGLGRTGSHLGLAVTCQRDEYCREKFCGTKKGNVLETLENYIRIITDPLNKNKKTAEILFKRANIPKSDWNHQGRLVLGLNEFILSHMQSSKIHEKVKTKTNQNGVKFIKVLSSQFLLVLFKGAVLCDDPIAFEKNIIDPVMKVIEDENEEKNCLLKKSLNNENLNQLFDKNNSDTDVICDEEEETTTTLVKPFNVEDKKKFLESPKTDETPSNNQNKMASRCTIETTGVKNYIKDGESGDEDLWEKFEGYTPDGPMIGQNKTALGKSDDKIFNSFMNVVMIYDTDYQFECDINMPYRHLVTSYNLRGADFYRSSYHKKWRALRNHFQSEMKAWKHSRQHPIRTPRTHLLVAQSSMDFITPYEEAWEAYKRAVSPFAMWMLFRTRGHDANWGRCMKSAINSFLKSDDDTNKFEDVEKNIKRENEEIGVLNWKFEDFNTDFKDFWNLTMPIKNVVPEARSKLLLQYDTGCNAKSIPDYFIRNFDNQKYNEIFHFPDTDAFKLDLESIEASLEERITSIVVIVALSLSFCLLITTAITVMTLRIRKSRISKENS